jgi:hypothetical protein
MATKKIEDLPEALRTLFEKVIIGDESFLLMVAEKIRDIIYMRTKSGKGLNKVNRKFGGATNEKLKDFSEKTRQQYINLRARSILGPKTTPSKSNLTFTGELLESIKAYVANNRGVVEIPDEQHWSKMSLPKLAEEVEKKRPFFGLSDTEMKILGSFINRELRKRFRELNNK